jgi:hypothetical protein
LKFHFHFRFQAAHEKKFFKYFFNFILITQQQQKEIHFTFIRNKGNSYFSGRRCVSLDRIKVQPYYKNAFPIDDGKR